MAKQTRRRHNPIDRKVRSKRKRKASSTRWLSRHFRDRYVMDARASGYRSRAAFKLKELDGRFQFLKPGSLVVDLGAAPGGWSQMAVKRVGEGNVIAVDCNPIEPIKGVVCLVLEVGSEEASNRIADVAGRKADIVLSDMAPAATGHRATDHLRLVALCETALSLTRHILIPGGTFVTKVYQGGAEEELLRELRHAFLSVRHFKPPASRRESAETYTIALGYRGNAIP